MKNNIFSKLLDAKHRGRTGSFALVIISYIIIEALMHTGSLSSLFSSLLVPVTCYIVASIGLNMNVGISGELNLGQAGFMSVGAFTAVSVSGRLAPIMPNPIIRLIFAIVAGIIMAAVFGIIIGIPVLKLEGDYLAIVTLAFGQIIKSIITNMYLGFDDTGLHFSFVEKTMSLNPGGKMLLDGPMGATGVQRIANFTAGVILILISLIVVYNIIYSRSGRAIMAARDNRIAAESVGIDISKTKMLSFVLSASLAGAAGALYGLNYSTLVPAKFDFNTSILILVYVVLGGLGNMTGTIISTVILVLLPELLRSMQDYRMLIYAVVLIAIMILTNNDRVKTFFAGLRQSIFRKKQEGSV
ncbi:MAG: branched-chain amino acid ABC transporter permease [Lachnospiraceae bacterium]|nr:branched-chain amino acid ABC transporter permease [Lachnospiraceae bacterium]